MKRYSYEGILRAVGQVLDEAEARSFAIEDVENGLVVRARMRTTNRTSPSTSSLPTL